MYYQVQSVTKLSYPKGASSSSTSW